MDTIDIYLRTVYWHPHMANVILVTGEIGSGKTTSCLYVLGEARRNGLKVSGILSRRVFGGDDLVGYDGFDCSTGETFPLARKRGTRQSDGWFPLRNSKYAFNRRGFERANELLRRAAVEDSDIVIVDEVGKVEMEREGLYHGLEVLRSELDPTSTILVVCRKDAVPWTLDFLEGSGCSICRWTPGKGEELWCLVEEGPD